MWKQCSFFTLRRMKSMSFIVNVPCLCSSGPLLPQRTWHCEGRPASCPATPTTLAPPTTPSTETATATSTEARAPTLQSWMTPGGGWTYCTPTSSPPSASPTEATAVRSGWTTSTSTWGTTPPPRESTTRCEWRASDRPAKVFHAIPVLSTRVFCFVLNLQVILLLSLH